MFGVAITLQPGRFASGPVGFPRSVEFDNRGTIPNGRIRLKTGGADDLARLRRVGARDALPSQFQNIPVAVGSSDVFQPGGQRLGRIGANGPVERAPVVQGIGERTCQADFTGLATYDQRQDARRPVVGRDDQYAEFLARAIMLPIDFQPFEGLKERSADGLTMQHPPFWSELSQLIDPIEFQHFGHRQTYFTARGKWEGGRGREI